MIYSTKTITKIQKENDFSFKKKFGQNFIVDENTINKIVEKSNIDQDTLVLEIGPGIGSLTYKLCEKAGFVLCYEIDESLKMHLDDNLKGYNNYKVIYKDFLKENINEELEKYNYKKAFIIANLPYYITTPIIEKVIEDDIKIDKMALMMQKEVGNRLKAIPGTKEYNSLSIYINYYFEVNKMMDVSRKIFIPEPNVDSIVVEFIKREEKEHLKNDKVFFKLVRDSFTQKRKTIKNNLKSYDVDKIEKILQKNNFTLSSRAEQIPISVFVEIANSLEE